MNKKWLSVLLSAVVCCSLIVMKEVVLIMRTILA